MYRRRSTTDRLSEALAFPLTPLRRNPTKIPAGFVREWYPLFHAPLDPESLDKPMSRAALLGSELTPSVAAVYHTLYRNMNGWAGNIVAAAEIVGIKARTAERYLLRARDTIAGLEPYFEDPTFWKELEEQYRSQRVIRTRQIGGIEYVVRGRWKAQPIDEADEIVDSVRQRGYVYDLSELERAHALYKAACDDIRTLQVAHCLIQQYISIGGEEEVQFLRADSRRVIAYSNLPEWSKATLRCFF